MTTVPFFCLLLIVIQFVFVHSSSESDCDIDEFVDTIEGIPATFPNESLRISKQSLGMCIPSCL